LAGCTSTRRPGVSRAGVAATLAALGCLASAGVSPATAGASRGIPQAWTSPKAIPKALASQGVTLATYGGKLYAAWDGSGSTSHLWYAAYNGTKWSAQAKVPSVVTNQNVVPALAEYNGALYVAWVGTDSGVWYSAYNGSSWTPQAEVPLAKSDYPSALGLAAYGADLYVSWFGQSGGHAWYSAYNGSSWTGQAKIPNSGGIGILPGAPGLAAFGNNLVASWLAVSASPCAAGCVVASTFNGATWSGPVTVASLGINTWASNLAVDGSLLYSVFLESTHDVGYSTSAGSAWSAVTSVPSLVSYVCNPPAAATYNGSLYVAYIVGTSPPDTCRNTGAIDYAKGP
jgi:hypothetical protein